MLYSATVRLSPLIDSRVLSPLNGSRRRRDGAALLLTFLALLSTTACQSIVGIEDAVVGPPTSDGDTTGDGSADTTGDGDGDTTGDGDGDGPVFACSDDEFVGEGSATGNNEASSDDEFLSCGDGSAEVVVGWTAPVTDFYVFDTFGSAIDTVLGIKDDCGGTELACNDNAPGSSRSEIIRRFEQGETVILVGEGVAGDAGALAFNVNRVECPGLDVTGRTFPLRLSTSGFGDDFDVACNDQTTAGNEDRAYHFTVPTSGVWRFSVTSEAFQPSLSVFPGARCGDEPELGCSNAQRGGLGLAAEVTRRLAAGTVVGVAVDSLDGGAGDFELDIQRQSDCVTTELVEDAPPESFDIGTQRILTPSCTAPIVFSEAGPQPNSSRVFSLTVPAAPAGGNVQCDVTVGGTMLAVAILDGQACAGREVACATTSEGNENVTIVSFQRLGPSPEREISVVVSERDPLRAQSFTIFAQCFVAIP